MNVKRVLGALFCSAVFAEGTGNPDLGDNPFVKRTESHDIPAGESFENDAELLNRLNAVALMQIEAENYLKAHGYVLKKDVRSDPAEEVLPSAAPNSNSDKDIKSESGSVTVGGSQSETAAVGNTTASITSTTTAADVVISTPTSKLSKKVSDDKSLDPRLAVVPFEILEKWRIENIKKAKEEKERSVEEHGEFPPDSSEAIRAKYAKWREEKLTLGLHEHGYPGSGTLYDWEHQNRNSSSDSDSAKIKPQNKDLTAQKNEKKSVNHKENSIQKVSDGINLKTINHLMTLEELKNYSMVKKSDPKNKVSKDIGTKRSTQKSRVGYFRFLGDRAKKLEATESASTEIKGGKVGHWDTDNMGLMAARNQRLSYQNQLILNQTSSDDGYPHGYENGYVSDPGTFDDTPAVALINGLITKDTYMNCEAGYWEPLHVGDSTNMMRPYSLATANDHRCRENCYRLSSLRYRVLNETDFLVDSSLSGCVFPVVVQHPVNVFMIQNDTQWYGEPERNSLGGSRIFYNVFLDDVKSSGVQNIYDISQVLAAFDTSCPSGIDSQISNATLLLRMGGMSNTHIWYGNTRPDNMAVNGFQMHEGISDSMKAEIKGASTSQAIVVDTSFWFRKWLLADHIPTVLIGAQTACPEGHQGINLWNSTVIVEEAGAWAYGIDTACQGKTTCGDCLASTTDQQRPCTWCSLPDNSVTNQYYDAIGFNTVSQPGSDGRCGLGEVSCLHLGGQYKTTC